MNDDLVQFLRDRLDEDEQTARRACEYAEAEWRLDEEFGETILWWPPEPHVAEKEREHGLPVVSDQWRGQTIESSGQRIAPHIARHDPARVLAEVEAKRRLLAGILAEPHATLRPGGSTAIYCGVDSGLGEPCECGRDVRVSEYVRLLALPYATHPDYRAEWRAGEDTP